MAVTRAKRLFVLAVHAETFAALKEKQPEFFALFEPAKKRVPIVALNVATA